MMQAESREHAGPGAKKKELTCGLTHGEVCAPQCALQSASNKQTDITHNQMLQQAANAVSPPQSHEQTQAEH